MSTRWRTGLTLFLALVVVLALNALSSKLLSGARIDLTEQSLFTLSDGTRSILSKLEEPVTVRLYLSQKLATRLPGVASYANRVKELLAEYERLAGGMLRVTVIDPEPFSEEEDRAVAYGLSGVAVGGVEDLFYFGLVGTGSTDEQEIIPYFTQDREAFLEYDITRLVYGLSQPNLKRVGMLSSIALQLPPQSQGAAPVPWMIVEQIGQLFDIQTIDKEAPVIPPEISVLMIVHPKNLSATTRYAIDQYVLGGGKALVFLDPFAGADRSQMTGGASSSNLADLLARWGLEMRTDVVVSDMDAATQVQAQQDGRMTVIEYPVWMSLDPQQFNPEDIVTADVGPLTMASAGALLLRVDKTTDLNALIQSTGNAMLADKELLSLFADPQDLLRNFEPTGEPFVLAARVTGKALSAFPDGPPDPVVSQEGVVGPQADAGAHLSESSADINVIVVADTDMLRDQFWVQVQQFMGSRVAVPTAANNAFVINALDNLTGSGDLISIRNRGTFSRPFDRVDALRQQAEVQFREQEQRLLAQLKEAESRLLQLEEGKSAEEALIVNDEQQAEIDRFQSERLKIRKELRDVRHELRKNIEALEGWLKFLNIGLVPIVILVVGLILGTRQFSRRKPVV